ncbi:unnamed protein product [Diplocarpon coronariae]
MGQGGLMAFGNHCSAVVGNEFMDNRVKLPDFAYSILAMNKLPVPREAVPRESSRPLRRYGVWVIAKPFRKPFSAADRGQTPQFRGSLRMRKLMMVRSVLSWALSRQLLLLRHPLLSSALDLSIAALNSTPYESFPSQIRVGMIFDPSLPHVSCHMTCIAYFSIVSGLSEPLCLFDLTPFSNNENGYFPAAPIHLIIHTFSSSEVIPMGQKHVKRKALFLVQKTYW